MSVKYIMPGFTEDASYMGIAVVLQNFFIFFSYVGVDYFSNVLFRYLFIYLFNNVNHVDENIPLLNVSFFIFYLQIYGFMVWTK